MSRLNLTLDVPMFDWIEKHAKRSKVPQASFARTLLQEAIERRELIARRRKLAADYAADRADASELLESLEVAQIGDE